jgi:hypothetical protein
MRTAIEVTIMRWFQLRPTFDIELTDSREMAIEKICAENLQRGKPKDFLVFGEYGELHLPESEHRLWSPHLAFYFHEHSDHCRIHGRFAPRVNVWTVVWIAYLAMIFTAFFSAMLAVSQSTIGQYPWGWWVVAAALVALVAIYVIAHIGQQWSADQMHILREKLNEILQSAKIGLRTSSTNSKHSEKMAG